MFVVVVVEAYVSLLVHILQGKPKLLLLLGAPITLNVIRITTPISTSTIDPMLAALYARDIVNIVC